MDVRDLLNVCVSSVLFVLIGYIGYNFYVQQIHVGWLILICILFNRPTNELFMFVVGQGGYVLWGLFMSTLTIPTFQNTPWTWIGMVCMLCALSVKQTVVFFFFKSVFTYQTVYAIFYWLNYFLNVM